MFDESGAVRGGQHQVLRPLSASTRWPKKASAAHKSKGNARAWPQHYRYSNAVSAYELELDDGLGASDTACLESHNSEKNQWQPTKMRAVALVLAAAAPYQASALLDHGARRPAAGRAPRGASSGSSRGRALSDAKRRIIPSAYGKSVAIDGDIAVVGAPATATRRRRVRARNRPTVAPRTSSWPSRFASTATPWPASTASAGPSRSTATPSW